MTNTAYALACCHALCEDCLDRVMETPYVTDNNDAEKYMHYQRPCMSFLDPALVLLEIQHGLQAPRVELPFPSSTRTYK